MYHHVKSLRTSWSKASMPCRVWFGALAVVSLSAGLLTASAALSEAAPVAADAVATPTATSSPASSASGSQSTAESPEQAGSAMDSMGSAPMSGPDMGGSQPSASGFCPNLAGTTVMADGMVMAPVPSGPPTRAEQAAANALVARVNLDIKRYSNLSAAEAAGYRPASNTTGLSTHYLNPAIAKSRDVLDPAHPTSLVYANTVDGPVLLGAMFLGPAPCVPGPDIGGPLTDWHAHDNLCLSAGRVVGRTNSAGDCASGTHDNRGYFMLHVWTAPSIAAQHQFGADLPPSLVRTIDRTGRP